MATAGRRRSFSTASSNRTSRVALDGAALAPESYTLSPTSLTLHAPPASGEITIRSRIDPAANVALEGLYLSSGVFCTQCEPEGFRRITYFPDRPDVLAVYTTTIIADRARYPVLLSNGNPVGAGDLPDGRHFAKWHDPFPKPTYLFALVAGDLAALEDSFTTMSGRRVALAIYSTPANLDRCTHAMESLKRAMRWDEERFGREYDLGTFMIFCADDFNLGAMENKGLNIFNSKLVLARPDTATDADYQAIEGVIGHEYFHNWTGNRVTCRDWFQLSLKEGLTVFRDQEFSSDMGSRAVERIAAVEFLRTHQFPEDAGPMAHPVRPDEYLEINNFYTGTVYEKGAEVIRMQHTLLGPERFRRGMDLYFARHDGQAVTCDDFVQAMQDAAPGADGIDLTQFRRWYVQAGTPVVSRARPLRCRRAPLHARRRAALPAHTRAAAQGAVPHPARRRPAGPRRPRSSAAACRGSGGCRNDARAERDRIRASVRVRRHCRPRRCRRCCADSRRRWRSTSSTRATSWRCLPRTMATPSAAGRPRSAASAMRSWARRSATRQACRWRSTAPSSPSSTSSSATAKAIRRSSHWRSRRPTSPTSPGSSETIDIDALAAARDFVIRELARALQPAFLHGFTSRKPTAAYAPTQAQIGSRALRNRCLAYLGTLDDDAARALAVAQYAGADNMTDAIAALAAINHSHAPEREALFARFETKWHDEPLVLDKWFALQATSQRPDTRQRVEALMSHPKFNAKNPNRVRSLLAAFALRNWPAFHAIDGSGYAFVADQVIALDRVNPHVSSLLAGAFNHWRRFTAPRNALQRSALERIGGQSALSPDVREIVMRNLAE